jgi:Derlin-2/3
MQLYFFSNFGSKLESHQRFSQGPGDYIYFLVIISALVSLMSLLVAWPRGYPLTGPSIIFAIIYYWSRCEPEARLSIWGFQVKGYQLPFALIFITLLMGGDIWKDLVGLAAGHIYYFMRDIIPLTYNVNVLKTPFFIHKLTARLVSGPAPVPTAPPAQGRFFVGQGVRLGGN